jgi:hypothetical protein
MDTSPPPPVSDAILGRQLEEWGKKQASNVVQASGGLLLGMVAWTRLHGIISLEIEGFFLQVGVDPSRVYDSEIDHLISQCVIS